tara:strand:- start:7360 stop:7860 length:501 start_codon:yes stop_codon:yes gene_type:complete
MIKISHVVALSNNNVIGIDNDLPWSLKSDLAHFKEYTSNKIIIMGRKTFESIGRPLPNRINYVVSTTIKNIDGVKIFSSTKEAIDEAYKECACIQKDEIVIIGGGYLFRETLRNINKLILTRVDCEIDGDIYYPEIDLSSWKLIKTQSFTKDTNNDYDFKIEEYIR